MLLCTNASTKAVLRSVIITFELKDERENVQEGDICGSRRSAPLVRPHVALSAGSICKGSW